MFRNRRVAAVLRKRTLSRAILLAVAFACQDGPTEPRRSVEPVLRTGDLLPYTDANLAVDLVTVTPNVVARGLAVTMDAEFTYAGELDAHTAVVQWGDGSSSEAAIAASNGQGTATAAHAYATAGVYTVTLTVNDAEGGSAQAVYEFVTVYDPDAGFVVGNGEIDSPAGAYTPDASLSGTARFGFTSRYEKGRSTPSGHTRFLFRAANFLFSSTDYDWLVVSGARAQYKGTGYVEGNPSPHGFLLTATDAGVSGGGDTDKFRVKIWDTAADEVVYDSQMGDSDNANPASVVRNGQIRIVAPNRNNLPAVTITAPADGSSFSEGEAITFEGAASDKEDGDLSGAIQWSSNPGGSIGVGPAVTTDALSVGQHEITASVVDADGRSASASITITIEGSDGEGENAAPVVNITAPADGASFGEGEAITFEGTASDAEDGDLSATIAWSSNLDGSIGTGASVSTVALTVGEHTITASVTDAGGLPGSASIGITVAANAAPTVTITSPADGASFGEGEAITFEGTASDAEDGDLSATIAWSSNLDGAIGTGASVATSVLSVGEHTITASVTDADGLNGSASIGVTVAANAVPVVNITAPADGASFGEGEEITFQGTAADAEDGDLSASIAWSSNVDGAIGTGASVATSTLSVGAHTITASVTDGGELPGSASIGITVVANAAPVVSITAPANGSTFGEGEEITFQGTATDAEDGDLSASIEWSSNVDGAIGTGASVATSTLSVGAHTITASVTDVGGLPGSASIGITVVANAAPVVTITAPADGATFEAGEEISFAGSATDPEDGPLTGGSLVWTSDLDGQIGTGESFSRNDLSVGRHRVTLTATDGFGAQGTASIEIVVVQAFISLPVTLNVPYTKQASLPVQLSQPAPAGGVTIELTSSDPTIVSVTPSVFIAGGAIAVNATVDGLVPGTVTVTAAATVTGYVPGESAVSATANLNITATSLTINNSFSSDITIQLVSDGAVTGAPPGGLNVTVSSDDAGCAVGVSPVTIPQGVISTTSTVSYGGSAVLPCTTTLTAGAPNIESDEIVVQVNQAPGINANARTIGSGLQGSSTGGPRLGASNHGGVTVTISSANPDVVLIAPNASTPGSESIEVFVADGSTGFSYVVQGLEGITTEPTVQITASAPGFTDGTTTATVVQAGYMIDALAASTTSLSPNDPFTVRIGVPNGTNTGVSDFQAVRAGGSALTVELSNSNALVGQLVTTEATGQTVTVQILPQQSSTANTVAAGGVAFDPLGAGSTIVSANIAGLIATTAAARTVTVSAPSINAGNARTVGSGLQIGSVNASLGASNHGGVTVTITSANPDIVLIAPDASTTGSESIQVFVADGSTGFSYVVQGLEGITTEPTVQITASAPGFTDGTTTATVVQAAYEIIDLASSTTSLSPDDPFRVRIGVPASNNSGISTPQAVRAGGTTLTVELSNSNALVGQLVTTEATGQAVTLQILPQQSVTPSSVAGGGVAFDPLGAGSTIVSANIGGLIATSAAMRTVTVSE